MLFIKTTNNHLNETELVDLRKSYDPPEVKFFDSVSKVTITSDADPKIVKELNNQEIKASLIFNKNK